jgi:hypothetical protein
MTNPRTCVGPAALFWQILVISPARSPVCRLVLLPSPSLATTATQPPCDAVHPSSTSFPLVSTRHRTLPHTPLVDTLATVNEHQPEETLTAPRTLALRTHPAQSTSTSRHTPASPGHRYHPIIIARDRQDRCSTLHYTG